VLARTGADELRGLLAELSDHCLALNEENEGLTRELAALRRKVTEALVLRGCQAGSCNAALQARRLSRQINATPHRHCCVGLLLVTRQKSAELSRHCRTPNACRLQQQSRRAWMWAAPVHPAPTWGEALGQEGGGTWAMGLVVREGMALLWAQGPEGSEGAEEAGAGIEEVAGQGGQEGGRGMGWVLLGWGWGAGVALLVTRPRV
jgi:hypothetical protein